jgi:hypothetical protein
VLDGRAHVRARRPRLPGVGLKILGIYFQVVEKNNVTYVLQNVSDRCRPILEDENCRIEYYRENGTAHCSYYG